MEYVAGVDLGTTYSAAAVGIDKRVEIFDLGLRSAAIPSVVLLRHDGTVLAGEVAERRSVTETTRTAREFKRRLGDPTPFLLGGTPYGAEALTGHLLAHIVGRISDQQGGPAGRVLLTHPANYGEYKLGYLEEAARLAGVEAVDFVPEPVAAAVHYASGRPLATGELLAVYDFGGGTLDIAMLRSTDAGFELIGTPEGMERFGGVDLDEAVFFHVQRSVGDAMEGIDPADPTATAALAALRVACREAKEALSADTDTTIPVMLPTVHTEVRLTRGEFEDMLRPRLRETITVLERVVNSAGAAFEDVSRVLLVGGASRIPLVAEMIRGETGRPVAIDANPKYAVAMGAARLALQGRKPTAIPVVVPVPPPVETQVAEAENIGDAIEEPVEAAPSPVDVPGIAEESPVEDPEPSEAEARPPAARPWGRWVGALLGLLAIAVIVVFATGILGDGGGAVDDTGATTAVDEQPPDDQTDTGPTEPPDGEGGRVSLGLVYLTQFRNGELEGDWGRWAIGEAQPPEDIASDYYPLLGPYASVDPGVLEQHMGWVEVTGADLLIVEWQGNALGNYGVFEAVLASAVEAGFAVAPFIEPYPGRTPDSVSVDIEELAARFGDHPAWVRSHRGSTWSDEPERLVVVVSAPEIIDDQQRLMPEDWQGVTDTARSVGFLVLAAGVDPSWVEGGRFDGLVAGVMGESFAWSAELPDGAWFVPVVSPGRSMDRLGEPDANRDREAGGVFERQWTAIGDSPRTPDYVIVMSFNGWADGTQIEPASSEPPNPRYRTYSPLEPMGYLEQTRELAERFLGSGK